jgi:4-amino-4-deoxy-L-arabinose transferase-like glycosyltransferase
VSFQALVSRTNHPAFLNNFFITSRYAIRCYRHLALIKQQKGTSMTTASQGLPQPIINGAESRSKRLIGKFSSPIAILLAIMALAAALNFLNLNALGEGNLYYTAAVKSMLQSPSNFFFVVAEPGGSVTIDKPPLGLWLQAISALFLGVNGFAVMLPQILAGIFAIPVMYHLVQRWFGSRAGLIAAFVLAVTPVSIAVQRNNTMDATLIFSLLLAAWAFIKATETGKFGWLLLGGTLIGLGFNIKMLQAFLPVPAFYALYFLDAPTPWARKVVNLTLTTVVVLAVSLAWLIAVDLIPASNRPYVGSSTNNSALELALGYNGVQRLLGGEGPSRNDGGAPGNRPPQNGRPPIGQPPIGGGMFGQEIGQAGPFRLFSLPLANEIGWLLPLGLFTIAALVFSNRPRLPLTPAHQAVLLWGGWLITQVIFFSMARFFHAYYLAMLAPPLAALVGIGVARLWETYQKSTNLLMFALITALIAVVVTFQIWLANQQIGAQIWLGIPLAFLVAGFALMAVSRLRASLYRGRAWGGAVTLAAVLVIPAFWGGMTTFDAQPSSVLPHAYSGTLQNDMPGFPGMPRLGGMEEVSVDQDLLAYLSANTQGMKYLMAVPSSMQGAPYVLATGRPVLYMGGFSGQDPVLDAAGLAALVKEGKLRYVLSFSGMFGGGPGGAKPAIQQWLSAHCKTAVTVKSGLQMGPFGQNIVYDCAS